MVVNRNTKNRSQRVVLLSMLPVFFVTVFILLLLIACEKEEFIHPVIYTGEVTGISSDGARFHGRIIIQSDVKIMDHGFVWGENINPEFGNAYTMSKGEPVSSDFTVDVKTTLEESQTYFVRAFARNDTYTWYGREVSFISRGSKAPVIHDVSPLSGSWGDTLTMKGRYFSFDEEENKVFLGPRCELTYSSDSVLKFVAPFELDTVQEYIRLSIVGNEIKYKKPFRIDPPVINNFEPKEGIFQTEVTIYGKNFHEYHTTVSLGGHELEHVEVSDTFVTFLVPTDMQAGNKQLRIDVLTQSVVADDEFFYRSPVITSMYPVEGTWRDTIKITGVDLVLDGHQTNVTFGNRNAEIIYADSGMLKVLVPDNLTDQFSWVKITTNEQTDTYNQFFTLLPPKVYHFIPEEAWFMEVIDIHGENFHPKNEHKQVRFGSISANILSSTDSLLRVRVPMGLDQIHSTLTVRSGIQETNSEESFHLKMHVIDGFNIQYGSRMDQVRLSGQGFTSNTDVLTVRVGETESMIQNAGTNHIWFRPRFGAPHGYNPVSVEILGRGVESPEMFFLYEPFERKSDIPYGGASPPVHFNINDRIYLGGGKGQQSFGSKDFWEYDPINNTWTERASIPEYARRDDHSFALNGSGYLLVDKQLFRYDPDVDNWTEMSPFPGFAAWGKSGFVLNGFAYVGCGQGRNGNNWPEATNEFWRYNPQTDSWLQLADHPFDPQSTSNGVIDGLGFAIQGKGYIGLGITSLLWEYDPDTDEWQVKIDFNSHFTNPRRRGMSALVIDEKGTKVYLSGGRVYSSGTNYSDMYIWDISENTVEEIISIPLSRAFHYSIPFQGKGFIGGGDSWNFFREDLNLFDPENLPPANR